MMVAKRNKDISIHSSIVQHIKKGLGGFMNKKFTKVTTSVLLCCIMILGLGITAYADTSSSWQYATVNGYSYKYRSSVWNRYFISGNTIEAVAEVKTSNDKNAPAGYMGAQARLYTSSGTLKYASSTVYNDVAVINIYAYSPRTTSSGYFYSQTKASFYNGNGYTTYTANKSPNASVPKALGTKGYKTNKNGETYGSGLLSASIGEDPDLISAIGTDSQEGYVRSEDLSPVPDSLEDAISDSQKAFHTQTIPLYNLSGEVIGEFSLDAMDTTTLKYISENSEKY